MKPPPLLSLKKIALPVLLTMLAILGSVIIVIFATPRISDMNMEYQGTLFMLENKPVSISSDVSPLVLHFGLQTLPMRSRIFRMNVVGCLEKALVNGKAISIQQQCPKQVFVPINWDLEFGPALREGINSVMLTISSLPGTQESVIRFSFLPSPLHDPVFIVLRWCFLLLLCFMTIFILRRWITNDRILILIVITGVIIRWRYASVTDIETRSHDWWGHLEYMQYLSKNWSIPPAAGGWEFQQPPLYYAVGALILRLGTLLGWSQGFSEFWIQQCSLPLSIITLLLSIWIGTILLRRSRRWTLWIFAGIASTLPSFVMVSSRVSNDALVTPLIFLSCGMLLLWWRKPMWPLWIWIWVTASIAILTKENGIVILCGAILCALLHRGSRIRDRLAFCMAGIAIFTACTSWLFFVRLQQSPADITNYLTTGTVRVNPMLRVDHTLTDFLIFNPIEMLKQPFIHPFLDETRRKNFFEYFFRSALFGEFRVFKKPQFAVPIVLYALLLLPWMFWGLISDIRKEGDSSLPFLLFSIGVFAVALGLAVYVPYAVDQDFRFSLLLGLTGTFLIVRGIEKSPHVLRMAGMILSVFLSVLMGAFMFVQ